MIIPSVSVIIPTYNRAMLLERAIRSVLSQTYRDFEIIIIDDASTDNTQEMLQKKFKQEIDSELIRYVKNETNMERSFSRNKGMELAKHGEYFSFLDDDDIWLPYHLYLLSDYMFSRPDVGIVFSNFVGFHNNVLTSIGRKDIKSGAGSLYRDLCIDRTLASNSTHLFRRSIFERLGGFMTDINFGEDREFFSRIAMNYNVGYINMVTTCINWHSGSYTSKKTNAEHALMQEKVWHLIEENSKKYAYPLSKELRSDYYLFLSIYFLPDTLKTKQYLLMALKINYKLIGKMLTWGLFFRVLFGQNFYTMMKRARSYLAATGKAGDLNTEKTA